MKLDKLSKIDNHETQNGIISNIRDLINQKNLEPGDKLPSERVLSEKFGVSRRNINEAIKKLEFYELVKSIPQTGTFIANIGQIALNGIIVDILRLEEQDFKSLVETRILLELKAAGLAAARRTEEDLMLIEIALDDFKIKTLNGEDALEEDLLFHLAIARASGNITMNALMLQITPKIISVIENNRVCEEDGIPGEIQRHVAIYEAIKNKEVEQAIHCMEIHFRLLIDFCNTTKEN
jgi:GntR family transcriptional repressor for pyruvate dehydrogenase complex